MRLAWPLWTMSSTRSAGGILVSHRSKEALLSPGLCSIAACQRPHPVYIRVCKLARAVPEQKVAGIFLNLLQRLPWIFLDFLHLNVSSSSGMCAAA